MVGRAEPIPEEIVVTRDRGAMRLVWSDGTVAALAASSLRAACRCAWCTRDRIMERFPTDHDAVALDQIEVLGSHGLHIKFSDGHGRGIFPWAYLDALASDASAPADHPLRTPPEPTCQHLARRDRNPK